MALRGRPWFKCVFAKPEPLCFESGGLNRGRPRRAAPTARSATLYFFYDSMNDETKIRGAGGTPGGLAEFFLGLVMAIAGAYLIVNRVVVASSFWSIGGYNTFGLSLVPLIFGIGILFFNGKSVIGWLLLIVGIVIIFAGILMNLQIYFQSTSLFNTIVMLVLLAGGIGLIFRALTPHGRGM